MTNKILVVLLLMFLSCGFANGQSCTLNVTLNATDTSTQTSGGVDLSTLVTQGGGRGPGWGAGFPISEGYNFASETISGDFFLSAQLMATTGTTTGPGTSGPAVALLVKTAKRSYVMVVVHKFSDGNYYLDLTASVYLGAGLGYSGLGYSNQQRATIPGWIAIGRVGNIYTGYASTDGHTWTAFSAFTLTKDGGDPSNAGVAIWSGDVTARNMATATLQNISLAGTPPNFTDTDAGSTGGNVGSGEPNIPFTFTETLSNISLSFASTGSCTQPQLNAIASVETNGYYQVQNVFSLYDVSAQNFVIKNTDSETMGGLVCATCSEPGFPATATTSFLFANAPLGYTYFVAQDVFFDNNSYNTLAAQNVSLNNSGGSTEYDGHISITKAANEYMILEGPPVWKYQMGPYPNYACTTRSIGTTGPDYKPVTFWTEDSTAYLYYKARSWCKRPHGSTAGTPWVCTYTANILFPFGIKGTNDSTYVDCTNWDLNIKGIWP